MFLLDCFAKLAMTSRPKKLWYRFAVSANRYQSLCYSCSRFRFRELVLLFGAWVTSELLFVFDDELEDEVEDKVLPEKELDEDENKTGFELELLIVLLCCDDLSNCCDCTFNEMPASFKISII